MSYIGFHSTDKDWVITTMFGEYLGQGFDLYGITQVGTSAVGFDEGLKPENWAQAFERRGIEVVRDVRREEAVAVLNEYRERGGIIYNGGVG